ncbi:hypothetical protein [Dyella sp.]|uniref:hypothetical protein n=1 Tax=Dyella sp. TaxID=1869338 RepID=UPI002ED3C9EA
MALATSPRPAAGSPHHAIAFALPTGVKVPTVIAHAVNAIEHARRGRGALGALLKSTPLLRGGERQRGVRSDLLTNMCSVLAAVVAKADLQTNIAVAESPTPMPNGSRWLAPLAFAQVTKVAFGGVIPGEVSQARTERAAKRLAALGLIEVTQQSTRLDNGDILNLPAVKALTDRFWKVVRLFDLVVKVRKARDKETVLQKMQAILANIARRQGKHRAQGNTPKAAPPASHSGTPAAKAAAAAYEARAREMGLTGEALQRSIDSYMKRWRG